jgi:hypothetical protein
MKTLILCFAFASISMASFSKSAVYLNKPQADSIKLQVDGKHAYYQKKVKADSLPEGLIYVRVIQFMASKNFQQNYGYQEEGKLIFTTTQDLNINPVYVGDDNDNVDPYTVQFAITLDLKNGSYRYTINNVTIYRPTQNGNKRETLYDIYVKATNTDSRRIAKDARKVIESFERYIDTLTDELNESIVQKSPIYNQKF